MISYVYFVVERLHPMISIWFYRILEISTDFLFYYFNLKFQCYFSVPSNNSTEYSEQQKRIKMLERLKFHMVQQMSQTPSAQVSLCSMQTKQSYYFPSIAFNISGRVTSSTATISSTTAIITQRSSSTINSKSFTN